MLFFFFSKNEGQSYNLITNCQDEDKGAGDQRTADEQTADGRRQTVVVS
jgi:hypothetical protein